MLSVEEQIRERWSPIRKDWVVMSTVLGPDDDSRYISPTDVQKDVYYTPAEAAAFASAPHDIAVLLAALEAERMDHEAAKERLRLAAQRISELEHRLKELRESMEYIDIVISTHSTLELDDHWYGAVSRTLSETLREPSS